MGKQKNPLEQQDTHGQAPEKKTNLSSKFLDTIRGSLTSFSKISEEERTSLYGHQPFLDQFWEYFVKEYPDLLGGLKKDELPAYLSALEKKGFSLQNIIQDSDALHKVFSPEKPEREVMQETLGQFDRFCKSNINNMPSGVFKRFADKAWFDHESYNIPSGSNLKTVDDLYIVWKKFVENEHIDLWNEQKKNIENVLCPDYDPVERVMVEIAITKIKKALPRALHDDFDAQFPIPITAFSTLNNLRTFQQERLTFLDLHKNSIDEPLAKKLDAVIVNNGDIKKLLMASGKKFDQTKSFEEWEHYFLRVFNKLATRQLFEEVKHTTALAHEYLDVIQQSIQGFPPYVNEIFKRYPYDDQLVLQQTPTLHTELVALDKEIMELTGSMTDDRKSKEERLRLAHKKKELKQRKEEIKRKAYLKYLETKNSALAQVMGKLVTHRFDFTQLSVSDQQTILNILVKDKIKELITHQAAELLDVDQDNFQQFVEDLFDLSKMDVTIPTKEWPVLVHFQEKKFISQAATQLLAVNDLSELKTLPLQFVVQQTPSSQEFFEESILRWKDGGMLFDTFQSKQWPIVLNDSYQVRLKKDGKEVTGYLSQYPPADVPAETLDSKTDNGETRYLYSAPVTDFHQERAKVFREGTTTPVTIPITQESSYDLTVLDRSFALNGDAIGSLLFAYVLGQQSLCPNISPQEEKELAQKMGKLNSFLDTQGNRIPKDDVDIPETTTPGQEASEQKEKSAYDLFLEQRKNLDGYNFPQDKESAGFQVGSKLFVKVGKSSLPPYEENNDAWMHITIEKIDKAKWTFTISMHWGEYRLGKHEWVKKEIPLHTSSRDMLKEIMGSEIYKVPNIQGASFDTQIAEIKKSFGAIYTEGFAYTFDQVKTDGDGFVITQGDFSGEKVAGFGYDMKVPFYDEKAARTIEKIQSVLFEVRRKADGSYRVSCQNDFVDAEGNPIEHFVRDMDPTSFALFIAGKKLQPKASKDIKQKKELKAEGEDRGFNRKKPRFSINNIASFFTLSVNKVKDGIKKYDEEKADDLTDIVLQNGDLFNNFGQMWWWLSSRIGTGFETAGLEYYTTRDARVWKKIEKRQKMYEQEKHYPSFFYHSLNDMISGKKVPRDMYKIPAMLLTVINKEKSPYARHYDLIGKGQWVNMILGKDHQTRYLNILNTKMNDLRQNSALNGTDWTIHRNQEIVKLEMQYLIDVIDAREHRIADQEKYQSGKWSRTFAEKLHEAMNTKFGFNEIQTKHSELTKSKSTTFEFAEFEYARHTRTWKAASAFPYLKIMAEQAQTQAQWEQFEMHIVSSTLSWWFLYGTDANTKWWIKDICRSRWFIPGLFAKDIDQQSKMLTLINIFLKSSGEKFEDFSFKLQKQPQTYDLNKYTIGNMANAGGFVWDGFKQRRFKNDNGKKFSKFLEISGKDKKWKSTILELLDSDTLANDEKAILEQYITLTNEVDQDIDADVRHNFSAMSGTPFTKSETIVKEMLKYEDGSFEGKDSHEKTGPTLFWTGVTDGIPKGKACTTDIVFYINKFFTWFDSFGYGEGSQKIRFIKRLLTVKEMFASSDPKRHKEAEDMLWYILNGTIMKFNGAGKGNPPKQLDNALNAFKSFFKSNLDEILSPHILSSTMWEFYAKDEDANTSYDIWDRSEYVEVMTNKASLIGQDKEQNKEISKKYESGTYVIYKDLYSLADELDRVKGQRNRFKDYYTYKPRDTTTTGSNQKRKLTDSGIAINNPQMVQEAIKKTLNSRPQYNSTNENEEEEFVASMDTYD